MDFCGAPLVGYCYGKNKKTRMRGIVKCTVWYGIFLGAAFAVKSLTITVLRNAVLFILGVILLNRFWELDGVIAAHPVVETVLTVLCLFLYVRDINLDRS